VAGTYRLPSIGALGAMVLIAGCQSAPQAPAFELAEKPWEFDGVAGRELVTDHFDVRTTIGDRVLVDALPKFLETCHRRYEALTLVHAEPGERLPTYVFFTRKQWERFSFATYPSEAPNYQNIQNGGYTRGDTAVLYWLGRSGTLGVLAHEGLHQFVTRHWGSKGPVPAWINEGLATQMEAYELRDGVPVFEPHKNLFRRNDLRDALVARERGLYDLPQLLRMDAGHAVRGRERSVGVYYAQVWSTVLFLLAGPNETYRDGFVALRKDMGTEQMRIGLSAYAAATPGAERMSLGELMFRKYITEDYDVFMAAYLAFAKELVGFRA
jgi:hypothetical protein